MIDDEKYLILYIITEYYENCIPLHLYIQNKPPSIPISRSIFKDIISALDFANRVGGVWHKCINPHFIFVDKSGKARVSDFIFSYFLCAPSGESHSHINKEITSFTSPEILQGSNNYSEEALVWSCGVILYYIVSAHTPYDSCKKDKLISAIAKEEPNLSIFSGDLQDLLGRMLCKFPKKRIKLTDILSHPWVAIADRSDCKSIDDKEIKVNKSERRNAITKVHVLTHVGVKPPKGNSTK